MERIMSLWHFCCLDMSLNYQISLRISFLCEKHNTIFVWNCHFLKITICFINTINGAIDEPYLIQTYFSIKKESSILTSPVTCQNNVRKKKKKQLHIFQSVCIYVPLSKQVFFYNPKIYIVYIYN